MQRKHWFIIQTSLIKATFRTQDPLCVVTVMDNVAIKYGKEILKAVLILKAIDHCNTYQFCVSIKTAVITCASL